MNETDNPPSTQPQGSTPAVVEETTGNPLADLEWAINTAEMPTLTRARLRDGLFAVRAALATSAPAKPEPQDVRLHFEHDEATGRISVQRIGGRAAPAREERERLTRAIGMIQTARKADEHGVCDQLLSLALDELTAFRATLLRAPSPEAPGQQFEGCVPKDDARRWAKGEAHELIIERIHGKVLEHPHSRYHRASLVIHDGAAPPAHPVGAAKGLIADVVDAAYCNGRAFGEGDDAASEKYGKRLDVARDKLYAALSIMEPAAADMGEPVGYVTPDGIADLGTGRIAYVYPDRSHNSIVPLYRSPIPTTSALEEKK